MENIPTPPPDREIKEFTPTTPPPTQPQEETKNTWLSLVKFEFKETDLAQMASEVKDLVIKDLDDKEGLKAVETARKKLKATRVAIEKAGKQLRESTNKFNTAVIERQDELISHIAPTEDILDSREKAYYEEKTRKREEEIRKANEELQKRLTQLREVNHEIDIHTLKGLTDEQYDEILKEATDQFEKDKAEKKRQEEEELVLKKKQEKEEADRKKKEEADRKKFEEDRKKFLDEQAAFNKQKEEAEQKQRQFKADQERLAKEKNDMKARKLMDIGLKWNGVAFQFASQFLTEPLLYPWPTVVAYSDIDFLTECEKIKLIISEVTEKQKKFDEEERSREIEAAKKKALAEKEESDRKAKEDEEEKLRFSEDTDRFASLGQQIDVSFLKSAIWGYFKSKKAKAVASAIQNHLKEAHALCEANVGLKNRNIPAGDKIVDGSTNGDKLI